MLRSENNPRFGNKYLRPTPKHRLVPRRSKGSNASAIGGVLSASFIGYMLLSRDSEALASQDLEQSGASLSPLAYNMDEILHDGQEGSDGPGQSYYEHDFENLKPGSVSPVELRQLNSLSSEPAGDSPGLYEYGTLSENEAAVQPDSALAPFSSEINLQTLSLPEQNPSGEAISLFPEEDLGDIGVAVTGTSGNDTIIGTDRNDLLEGNDGDDVISGLGGDDNITGGQGNDTISGGDGNDMIDGGSGSDQIAGDTGNDTISGGSGDDQIDGGSGNDRIDGGSGDDTIDGGSGFDSELDGGTGDDTIFINTIHDAAIEDNDGRLNGGNDTVVVSGEFAQSLSAELPTYSPDGSATFVVGGGDVSILPEGHNIYRHQIDGDIENVRLLGDTDHDIVGHEADNRLEGNAGDNKLWGEEGEDLLYGGAGDDDLYGGSGDDELFGGDGEDSLYGSDGDDVYVLGLNDSAVDTIFDREGANSIRVENAETDRLGARIEDGNAFITYDDRTVGKIDGYENNPENFTTIAGEDGEKNLTDLLDQESASFTAARSDDLLTQFFSDQELNESGGGDPDFDDSFFAQDPAFPDGVELAPTGLMEESNSFDYDEPISPVDSPSLFEAELSISTGHIETDMFSGEPMTISQQENNPQNQDA